MLNTLMRRLPTAFLNNLLDAAFFELQLRGEIIPEKDGTRRFHYNNYEIKIITEPDNTYTSTWEVYQGETLLCEGNNEFHDSEGEAEYSAIQWIKRCQSLQEKCSPSS